MDNIQLEITEKNRKVTFNNKIEIKTIPNNDHNRMGLKDDDLLLKQIYGMDLDKEKVNQAKILADINRKKTIDHINNIYKQLANMNLR
tara:strand:+ start:1897 stop:2160 length:264 start_codon:yes stop_codon:yes gene_type:complete